jgi:hypothetical protein
MTSINGVDYNSELNSAYNTYNIALEEMSKSYIDYKLNNNSSEYNLDRGNLEKAKTDIYQYSSDIQNASETTKKKILELNEKIATINAENKKLSSKLTILDEQDSGAVGALEDKTNVYNELYIQNIVLLVMIILNSSLYLLIEAE